MLTRWIGTPIIAASLAPATIASADVLVPAGKEGVSTKPPPGALASGRPLGLAPASYTRGEPKADEVIYRANPAMFRDSPVTFALAVLLVPFGIGLIVLIAWYIRVKTAKLIVTQRELIYEVGILSKHRVELRIANMRSLRVKQRLLQRLFRTGDIEIYTAGDRPEIVIKGMRDPGEIRRLIGRPAA